MPRRHRRARHRRRGDAREAAVPDLAGSRAAWIGALHETAGNAAVSRMLSSARRGGAVPSPAALVPEAFVDGGRAGSVPAGGAEELVIAPGREEPVPHAFRLAPRLTGPAARDPAPGAARAAEEMEEREPPLVEREEFEPEEGGPRPVSFVGGGRTGTVAWAGGGGAGPHGNEPVGSIQFHFPPLYWSRSNGLFSDSEAWVLPGSAQLFVRRSWLGSDAGDQGNGWYVTPAAAARLDRHEALHVITTMSHYMSDLLPVLTRAATLRTTAYTQVQALLQLRDQLAWAAGVQAFQAADTADNQPMGTVDSAELSSGTYVVNVGPGTVGGTAYTNRLKIPSEPNPT